MTVRQFNKLPDDEQAEVHRANLALLSPSNVAPLADPEPADTRAIPRGHLPGEQKLAIGRWLLHQKASLPHGHFGPWLEKQEWPVAIHGLKCMRLATGGR
ncbi:DUF3102 domain-containing protein [Mesorhizobium sp. B283B1A]|nr:DUF3102 domain-containing protein [Mesorhizobium sp. B283B1A]